MLAVPLPPPVPPVPVPVPVPPPPPPPEPPPLLAERPEDLWPPPQPGKRSITLRHARSKKRVCSCFIFASEFLYFIDSAHYIYNMHAIRARFRPEDVTACMIVSYTWEARKAAIWL
ncbi:MAG: hypothetical protein E3J72_16805 [Planctomycetota bacterium]|nr:MAG: hypothetical protein E3J72_16805 [Planctomycetota bacterium]